MLSNSFHTHSTQCSFKIGLHSTKFTLPSLLDKFTRLSDVSNRSHPCHYQSWEALLYSRKQICRQEILPQIYNAYFPKILLSIHNTLMQAEII